MKRYKVGEMRGTVHMEHLNGYEGTTVGHNSTLLPTMKMSDGFNTFLHMYFDIQKDTDIVRVTTDGSEIGNA